jgi:hypothetical protein
MLQIKKYDMQRARGVGGYFIRGRREKKNKKRKRKR